jgi:hypothetical protein
MKVLVVVVALGLPAAAGAHATPSPSGLRGLVTRGPISPACVAEQPCTEPAKNLTLIFSRDGRVAARRTTDSAGRYRVVLRPGLYRVTRTVSARIGRGLEPDHARVLAGRFVRVDFSIDTGIR